MAGSFGEMKRLCQRYRDANCYWLTLRYTGSYDGSDCTEFSVTDSDDKEHYIGWSESEHDVAWTWATDELDSRFPDWCGDYGSHGTIHIDLRDGQVSFEHVQRVLDENEHNESDYLFEPDEEAVAA